MVFPCLADTPSRSSRCPIPSTSHRYGPGARVCAGTMDGHRTSPRARVISAHVRPAWAPPAPVRVALRGGARQSAPRVARCAGGRWVAVPVAAAAGRWRGRRAVGLADGHFPFALAPMVTVLLGVRQEGGDIEKRCYFSVVPHRRGCRRPLPGRVSPTPAMARAELVFGSQLCGKTETRGWIMKVIGKGCLL